MTLLQKYGANAWRIHNYQLEQQAKNMEKALDMLKELTVDVNRDRKNTQVCISATQVYLLYISKVTWSVGEDWAAANCAGDTMDRASVERPTDWDGERGARGGCRAPSSQGERTCRDRDSVVIELTVSESAEGRLPKVPVYG